MYLCRLVLFMTLLILAGGGCGGPGWYCADVPGSRQCTRTLAACERMRSEDAACERTPRAVCIDVFDVASNQEKLICTDSNAECTAIKFELEQTDFLREDCSWSD